MDDKIREIIINDIAPLVQSGGMSLLLGAGFSAESKAKRGPIPGVKELKKRIAIATGNDSVAFDSSELGDVFEYGKDNIKNFNNFLIENFDCTEPQEWQTNLFCHWWQAVFTTNIDNVVEKAISRRSTATPEFVLYNYNNPKPVDDSCLTPPIVNLHGTIRNLDAGVIFDSYMYSRHSVVSPDWLRDVALRIAHGNFLFVGFSFKEQDIETELRKRELWDTESSRSGDMWIVSRSIDPLKKGLYIKKGIIPLECTAKEFCEVLNSSLTVLSPSKFLKRKYPHISISGNTEAVEYFNRNFDHVPTRIAQSSKERRINTKFFCGDEPAWYYIANGINAHFDYYEELISHCKSSLISDSTVSSLIVVGSVASGKTSVCKTILCELAKANSAIYEYASVDGIDVESCWKVLQNVVGNVVLYFSHCHEQFYAINELASRFKTTRTQSKLLIIIEERTYKWYKNKFHIQDILDLPNIVFDIPRISPKNASTLVNKLIQVGSPIASDIGRDAIAKQICDLESGFRGDLLATLYVLVTGNSFSSFVEQDYADISSEDAQNIFKVVTLVSSADRFVPITYLSEILNISPVLVFNLLTLELKGKVFFNTNMNAVSSRHSSLALEFVKQWKNSEEKTSLIIKLFDCISSKFTIGNFKSHPASFRIYKELINFDFLKETLSIDLLLIGEIFHHCQQHFSKDGQYWLQYGIYHSKQKRYSDAVACFKNGLSAYDLFMLRHSLGVAYLDLYCSEGCVNVEYFDEGCSILRSEILSRGDRDSYPYNALIHRLTSVYSRTKSDDLQDEIKKLINEGMRYFREDEAFMGAVSRFYATKGIKA